MENDQSGNFICRFCKGSFTQAQHLYKHVQLIHAANPSTKNSRTCPICGTVFAKYEGYRTHLRHIHGQRNEGQIFAFKCFNDFFLWKTELENRSLCKYSLHTAPKLLPSNEKIHVYQCDATKKKKCSLSGIDSCAALICATESMKNHEIKVEYWNTHLGHSVPVEEDELNAAINSVQSSEEPTMHVMDMLNSIDQSIETGAEVFVTETIEEEEHSLSPVPKKNQKNIFNIKKTKPSAITSVKNPPIVQNFSFKKDPSKKKESSIYSLASVACGKISANKTVKSTEKSISKIFQNSMKKNVQKSMASNSAKNIASSISELTDEDSLSHIDPIPNSSLEDTSNDGQIVSINPSQLVTNKKQVVYNWPVGKPLPTDWVFSNPHTSEEKSSKNSKEKENISSISNKIIVPLGLDNYKSKEEKSAKPKISKVDISVNATKSNSKQTSNIRASAVVTTSATQFARPSVPLNTTSSSVSPQILNSIPSFNPAQLVPSVLPGTQTYLSVNDKLIPYGSCVLPSNLNSNVLLPVLPNPASRSLLQTSKSNSSTSKDLGSSYQSPLIGVVKQNSFAGSHLILLPCTNNSAVSSILQPASSTAISSPLVLQSMMPSTSASGSKMFSLLKPVTVSPSSQTTSLINTTKSPLSVSSSVPSNSSNAVKVQKVSLPTASSSMNASEQINTNSVLTFSQPSQVSSVVLNTAPISSTPTINISETNKSNVQKPGTFVFESSGELYMLEPLDDDIIAKVGNIPLTSTPKKIKDYSRTESSKRKYSAKKTTNENAVLQRPGKLKKSETSQSTSYEIGDEISKNSSSSEVTKITPNTIGGVKKKIPFPERNHRTSSEEELGSPLHKFERSILGNRNGSTIDSILTNSVCNDTISPQKTEMTIKIAPSQHLGGKKEVSIFTNTSPIDLKAKSPVNSLKYTPSQLTVKTVPSFSLHQSRPATSTLISLKAFTSCSMVTSSTNNYSSSALESITPINRSTSLLSCEKEAKTYSAFEGSLHQGTCPATQNVEVKRNVTIKSVVQEKRSATDDDLEVMKKVKFYKLEMKYLACQEQCKKLKIELAKALSKNKELLQDIEEKKEKNEVEQYNSNVRRGLIIGKEDTHAVESQKQTLNENRTSTDTQEEKLMNDEIQEERDEINFDVKSTSSFENLDDCDRSDSGNEMDVEFDVSSSEKNNKLTECDQVSKDQECTYNGKEDSSKERLDCDPQEMDVEEYNKYSKDFKETKKDTETKTNSNTDVFTMVRTSVLKNLYLNIEDLTEEKKQLQKDLEEYRNLDLKIVPSFEEYEDSL